MVKEEDFLAKTFYIRVLGNIGVVLQVLVYVIHNPCNLGPHSPLDGKSCMVQTIFNQPFKQRHAQIVLLVQFIYSRTRSQLFMISNQYDLLSVLCE